MPRDFRTEGTLRTNLCLRIAQARSFALRNANAVIQLNKKCFFKFREFSFLCRRNLEATCFGSGLDDLEKLAGNLKRANQPVAMAKRNSSRLQTTSCGHGWLFSGRHRCLLVPPAATHFLNPARSGETADATVRKKPSQCAARKPERGFHWPGAFALPAPVMCSNICSSVRWMMACNGARTFSEWSCNSSPSSSTT